MITEVKSIVELTFNSKTNVETFCDYLNDHLCDLKEVVDATDLDNGKIVFANTTEEVNSWLECYGGQLWIDNGEKILHQLQEVMALISFAYTYGTIKRHLIENGFRVAEIDEDVDYQCKTIRFNNDLFSFAMSIDNKDCIVIESDDIRLFNKDGEYLATFNFDNKHLLSPRTTELW